MPGPSSRCALSTQSPRLRRIFERLDRREALRPSLEPLVADRDLAALANRVTEPRKGGGERALDGWADQMEGVAGHKDCRDAVRRPGVGAIGEQDVTGSREDVNVASHPSHGVEARREGTYTIDGDAPVCWTHAIDPAVRRRDARRTRHNRCQGRCRTGHRRQQNPLHSTTHRAGDRDSVGSGASRSARSRPSANKSAHRRWFGRPAAFRRPAVRRRPALCSWRADAIQATSADQTRCVTRRRRRCP